MLPPVAFAAHPLPPPISSSYIAPHPEHAARGSGLPPSSLPMPASGHDPASVSLDGLNIIQLPLPQQQQQQQPTAFSPATTAEHNPGPDSPTKTSTTSSSSSRSSLSRRRSVSSMKGLMPLTLSTSASSFTNPILPEDGLEQRVDDYLPELLARDLELASDIFEARSMTAGAPSYSLVAEYMARAKAAGQFTNRLSMAIPYQPASARVQILGPIEERDSMASFLEQQEHQQQHHHSGYPDTSDLDSVSSAGDSAGMPPPSFRYHRNTSIVTEATSLTDSVRKQSPQPSQPLTEPAHLSWIDGDSDEEEFDSVAEALDDAEEPLSPLSPRPPTPPAVVDNDASSLDNSISAAALRSRFLHKKSHSATGVPHIVSAMVSPLPPALALRKSMYKRSSSGIAPIKLPRRASMITQEFQRTEFPSPSPTKQRRSESPMVPMTPPPVPQKHHQRISRMSEESLRRKSLATIASPTARQPASIMESPPMSDGYPSDGETGENHSIYQDGQPWRDQETDYSRPTPPASPPRHFVTLANSAKPYVPNFGGDELARVVPLPPDVVETLRVSVACFPETILLSSSLTIDTIRSYSKKMRRPETDLMRLPTAPSENTGRKSIWQKVNPLKKGSASRNGSMHSLSGSLSGSISVNIGGADSQKTWSAIQNVFGTCSEYICDALYAHIMAYNYVSALLARNAGGAAPVSNPAERSASRRRRGNHGGRSSSEQDDIPKKAASLLGLGDSNIEPPHAPAASGRYSRIGKRTSTMTTMTSSGGPPWSREELLPNHHAPTSTAGNEAPVRIVQEGLYKCIVRLIATARLMAASGRLDEPITDADATDADVLFMRSLCEIVRLVEETS
ncbi:hypothetical protein PWT90_09471 [Aphanocladium album]|nr:hypothetical protein PWT90_09471 [Aphanocladium album]